MKNFLILLFSLSISLLSAQSIEELEEQLAEASSSKEKMVLNHELAEAYLRVDSKKALNYARASHSLAAQMNNSGMAARTAYTTALAYERLRDDRNVEVWLKSTLNHAKKAGDSDLIIKSVDKRSRLWTKKRNYRKAYEINQEAFTYFSKNGSSISDLESKFEVKKSRLGKEQRILEKNRAELLAEVERLNQTAQQLSQDKSVLEKNQQELLQEREEVEKEISEREERLASIAKEKKQIEKDKERKERRIKALTKEALADSLSLAEKERDLLLAKNVVEQEKQLRLFALGGAGTATLLVLFILSLYASSRRSKRKLEEKNKIIEEERERSDELLLNILPSQIAAELKEYGKAKARKYEQVTVLFSDFKNFTWISERLSPEELVEELDKCFKAFDFIISQYEDIEKIKTIGDAYMCASGLSNKRTLPSSIIRASLEMQEFLEETKQERIRLGKPYFEARIGIHTGPVVAGVVGVNKFAYDIWGDTVNIASRMESQSDVGRVNISESTYRLVQYQFDCEYRGKVEAKNKGAIDMYYVRKETSAVTV